ncbi:hypothetical protein [Nostoc sp. PA-18-2419]|uniref:hypothetical protein n=1 Tax=Nostoc sp. PA-18-2419 TaxID=2575443 RepID=UPI00110942EE|nr:hypothetical protein [Nostoc sp. PA-18-2419]
MAKLHRQRSTRAKEITCDQVRLKLIKRKSCQVEQIPVSNTGCFLRPGYLVILIILSVNSIVHKRCIRLSSDITQFTSA